jgi:hypothetical protein
MKLIDSIYTNCSAQTVWTFLQNPENMLLWNPKVKRVSPGSFDQPRLGFQYAITYQMRDRAPAQEFLAEFVHFEPPLKLVIRLIGGLAPRHSLIEEIYELSERDSGTFLKQTIHLDNSGINIFFRFLIWFIQRTGKPTGKRYLETLRDIIERKA